jgi:hypothetical protein
MSAQAGSLSGIVEGLTALVGGSGFKERRSSTRSSKGLAALGRAVSRDRGPAPAQPAPVALRGAAAALPLDAEFKEF